MAVQTEIYLKGRLNNLVFYTSGGKSLVRSIPAAVKQSPNTLARSHNFGLAAAAGRQLRSLLAPVIPFPKDRKMQILFSGAISRWLGSADAASMPPQQMPAALTDFSFNTHTALSERCKIAFSFSAGRENELQIGLPAFEPAQVFAAPVGTQLAELSFTVAGCGLLQAEDRRGHTQQLVLPYTNQLQPAQTLILPATMEKGTLLIAAAAIRFINGDNKPDTRAAMLPAGVLWAAYY